MTFPSTIFPQRSTVIDKLPILLHRSKNGKVSMWEIGVEQCEGICYIVTRYGYVDGEQQTTAVKVTAGKNVGKSNQTSIVEQAIKQAQSKWENKKLSNYRESLEDNVTLLPMLAHRYHDHKDKVKFPCCIQRKLNGVRILAHVKDCGVKYVSRKGKEYETLHHWDDLILKNFPVGSILDGEGFNPNLNFQQIARLVKRVKADRQDIEHNTLNFWVYDTVQQDQTFIYRQGWLKHHFENLDHEWVQHLPAYPCLNHEDIMYWHKTFISEGYEGSIIRNYDGLYRPDYRSYDLLKLKDFLDEEFLITGGKSGTGKDEGTVIFICKINNKDNPYEFYVRPKGTWEERKEYFDNLQSYIGKWLTVRYQEKSEDGMPIFPVGISIRDVDSE